MPWIESHADLRSHPKLDLLCDLLDLSEWEGIGLLHCWWWWTLSYAEDGDLSRFTDKQVARAIGWTKPAEGLVAGLTEAGFLDADRTVHDWRKYAGRWIERRAKDRERKKGPKSPATSARDASAGVPDMGRPESGVEAGRNPALPDLTGPNLTGPNPSPQPPPPCGGGDAAAAAGGTVDDDPAAAAVLKADAAIDGVTETPVDSGAGPGPDHGPPTAAAEAQRIWTSALDELKLAMSAANFDSYLVGTRGSAFDDDVLTVAVDNPLVTDTLAKRFKPFIARALFEVVGRPCRVRLVSEPIRPPTARPADGMFALAGGG